MAKTNVELTFTVKGIKDIENAPKALKSLEVALQTSTANMKTISGELQKVFTNSLGKITVSKDSILGKLQQTIKGSDFSSVGKTLADQISKGMAAGAGSGGRGSGGKKLKATFDSIVAEEFKFLTDKSLFNKHFNMFGQNAGKMHKDLVPGLVSFMTKEQKKAIDELMKAGKTGRATGEIRRAMKSFQQSFGVANVVDTSLADKKDEAAANAKLKNFISQRIREQAAMKQLDALIQKKFAEDWATANRMNSDRDKFEKMWLNAVGLDRKYDQKVAKQQQTLADVTLRQFIQQNKRERSAMLKLEQSIKAKFKEDWNMAIRMNNERDKFERDWSRAIQMNNKYDKRYQSDWSSAIKTDTSRDRKYQSDWSTALKENQKRNQQTSKADNVPTTSSSTVYQEAAVTSFKSTLTDLSTAFSTAKSDIGTFFGDVGNVFNIAKESFMRVGGIMVSVLKTMSGAVVAATMAFIGFGMGIKSVATDILLSTEKMRGYNIGLMGLMKTQTSVNQLMKTSFKVAQDLPIAYDQVFASTKAFSLISPLRPLLTDSRNAEKTLKDLYTITLALSQIEPEWGIQGAIFSLREALSGDLLSLKRRFEIPVNLIASKDGKKLTEIKNDPKKVIETLSSYFGDIYGPESLQLTSRQFGAILAKIAGQFEQFKSAIGESGIYDVVVDDLLELQKVINSFLTSMDFKIIARRLSDAFAEGYRQVLKGVKEFANLFGANIKENLDFSNLSTVFNGLTTAVETWVRVLKTIVNVATDKRFQDMLYGYWKTASENILWFGQEVYGTLKDIVKDIMWMVGKADKYLGGFAKSLDGKMDTRTKTKGLIYLYLFGPGNVAAMIPATLNIISSGLFALSSSVSLLASGFKVLSTVMSATFISKYLAKYNNKMLDIITTTGIMRGKYNGLSSAIYMALKPLGLLILELVKFASLSALFVLFINGIYEIAKAVDFLHNALSKLTLRDFVTNFFGLGQKNPQDQFIENLDAINKSIDEFNANNQLGTPFELAHLSINDFQKDAKKVETTLKKLETYKRLTDGNSLTTNIQNSMNIEAPGDLPRGLPNAQDLKTYSEISRMTTQIRQNMTLIKDPNFGGRTRDDINNSVLDDSIKRHASWGSMVDNVRESYDMLTKSVFSSGAATEDLIGSLEKMKVLSDANIKGVTQSTLVGANKLQDVFKQHLGGERGITSGLRRDVDENGKPRGHGLGKKMDFILTKSDVDKLMNKSAMTDFVEDLVAAGVTEFNFEERYPSLFKNIDDKFLTELSKASKGMINIRKIKGGRGKEGGAASHVDVTFAQQARELGTAWNTGFRENISASLNTMGDIISDAKGNNDITATKVPLMKEVEEAAKDTAKNLANATKSYNMSVGTIRDFQVNSIKTAMEEYDKSTENKTGFAAIVDIEKQAESSGYIIKDNLSRALVESFTKPLVESITSRSDGDTWMNAIWDLRNQGLEAGFRRITSDDPKAAITGTASTLLTLMEEQGIVLSQSMVDVVKKMPEAIFSNEFKRTMEVSFEAYDGIMKDKEKQTEELKKGQLVKVQKILNGQNFDIFPNSRDYQQIFGEKIKEEAKEYIASYSSKSIEGKAEIELFAKTFLAQVANGKSFEEARKFMEEELTLMQRLNVELAKSTAENASLMLGIYGVPLQSKDVIANNVKPDFEQTKKNFEIFKEYAEWVERVAGIKIKDFMFAEKMKDIAGDVKKFDLNKLRDMTKEMGNMSRAARGDVFSAIKSKYERDGANVSATEALTMGMAAAASEFKTFAEEMYDVGNTLVTDLSSTFENGFFDFMTRKISNLGDMFKQMGQGILDTILKVISKMLALQATKLILGIDINAQGGMNFTGGGLLGGLGGILGGGQQGGNPLAAMLGGGGGASGGSGGGIGGMLGNLFGGGNKGNESSGWGSTMWNTLTGKSISKTSKSSGLLGMFDPVKTWNSAFGKGGATSKLLGAVGPVGIAAIAAGAFLSQKGRLFGGTVNNTQKEVGVYGSAQDFRKNLEARRYEDSEKYIAAGNMSDIGNFQFGANRYWETKSGNGITSKKTVSGNVDTSAFYNSADKYYKLLFESGKQHYEKMREIDKMRETDEMGAISEERNIKQRYLAVLQTEYGTAEAGRNYEGMDKIRDKILQTEDELIKMLDSMAKLAKDTQFRAREFEAYKTYSYMNDDEIGYQRELLAITKERASELKYGTIAWYDAQQDILEKQKSLSVTIKTKIDEINASFSSSYATLIKSNQMGSSPRLMQIKSELETLVTDPQSMTSKKTFNRTAFEQDIDNYLNSIKDSPFNDGDHYYQTVYGKSQRQYLIDSKLDKAMNDPKYKTVNVEQERLKLGKEQEQLVFDAEYNKRKSDLGIRRGNILMTQDELERSNMNRMYYDSLNARSKLGSGNQELENELKNYILEIDESLMSYYEDSANKIRSWINEGYLSKDALTILSGMKPSSSADYMSDLKRNVYAGQFRTGIYDSLKDMSSEDYNKIVGQIQGMGIQNIGTGLTQFAKMNVGEDAWESWYQDSVSRIKTRIENTKAGESEYFNAVNDLFNLMKEKSNKLKEKAEDSTQKMEDALTAIEETLKMRIAEERKSQRGDVIFVDTSKTTIDQAMVIDLKNKIKNGDPSAASLLDELKKKITGTSR